MKRRFDCFVQSDLFTNAKWLTTQTTHAAISGLTCAKGHLDLPSVIALTPRETLPEWLSTLLPQSRDSEISGFDLGLEQTGLSDDRDRKSARALNASACARGGSYGIYIYDSGLRHRSGVQARAPGGV